jgi:hypothetical protein
MEFIGGVLVFFSALGFVSSILGLIKPSIIEQNSRKEVLKMTLVLCVLFVVGMMMVSTDDSKDVGIHTVNDTQISKINMNTGKEFLSEITVSDYPFTSRD